MRTSFSRALVHVKSLFSSQRKVRSASRRRIRHTSARRAFLEPLENRCLLATFYVDNSPTLLGPGADVFTPVGGTQTTQGGLTFGTNLFSTIGAAVAAAAANAESDTINVADGTYTEFFTIGETLLIRGNNFGADARGARGPESTVTFGSGAVITLATGSAATTFDGFTVSGGARGIESASGPIDNLSLLNNRIVSFTGNGIFLNDSGVDITVSQNVIDGSSKIGGGGLVHLDTDNFDGFQLLNNNIVNGATATGFFVDGNHNVGVSVARAPLIQGNLIASNNTGMNLGSRAFEFGTIASNVFQNNNFDGLQGGIQNSLITLNTFTGNGRSGLALTSFGNMGADRGGQNTDITFNVFSGNGVFPNGEDVFLSSTQAPGTIGTNELHFNSFGSATTLRYGGTEVIDATCNWWGSITGPTISTNPGGTGGTLVNASGGVDFQPWLVYAPDGDSSTPGVQLVNAFTVPAQTIPFTSTNNNYRRLANAIDCLQDGQTVTLSGTFDWVEANAAASWAMGNDGVASTSDDFSLLVPENVNNVTITAAALGSARIQGPGDLAGANLEGVFVFDGGDNQNWTISNLEILDFDLSIGMFNGAGGSDAFNETTSTNNRIRVPADLNATAAPADVNQNIGIHFSFGTNQTISLNQMELVGSGASATPAGPFSSTVGMQSNTSGGSVYDGLLITGNILTITGVQAANPATILGIWDNGHAHSSNITVSNNQVLNQTTGGTPATNLIRAFRVTSHSSATTAVTYQGNTVTGANIGFQWLAAQNFGGNQPVRLIQNTVTGTNTGVQVDSLGSANLFQNTITGSLAAGVNVLSGSLAAGGAVTHAVEENFITGGAVDGIVVAAGGAVVGGIFNNDLSGNAGLGVNNLSGVLVDASGNWWGSNTPAGVAAEVSGLVDYTPWLDVGTDTSGTPGFQGNFATLHVDDTSPQFGSIGRIQEGIDLATGATPTVIIEAGLYSENVLGNKAGLTLVGATGTPTDVVIDPPGITDGITVTADNVTIRDLRITGAANALVGANLGTLTLVDLRIDASTSGGSLTNITNLNFTTSPDAETITISGSQFSATNVQAVTISGVTNFNAFGDSGSDTFNVTPAATMTINIDGDQPTPPASPGDTLNVDTSGTTNPTLSSTSTPSGLQGSYTFGDRANVNFQEIETLGSLADLQIDKVENADPVTAGTDLTYTITLTNAGSVAAQNVNLSDVIPANTTFISFTAPAGFTPTTPAVGGTGTVTATNPSLAAGSGPQTFTLVVRVNANTPSGTAINNTATVSTTTNESSTGNNSDTEETFVVTSADVSVTKTDSPDPVAAGGNLTYTIVVMNNGPSDAQTVTLTDVIPAGTTFVSFTEPSGFTSTEPPVGSGGNVSSTATTLAAGSGPQTFVLVVRANSSLPNGSTISNTATVTTATTDPNPGNDFDTEATDVVTSVDISVDKSDSPDPVAAGANLTYTILVSAGPSDAQNVTLTDVIPPNTTFVSFTAPAGWSTTTPPVGGSGMATSTRSTFTGGTTATFILVVQVDSDLLEGDIITNTVNVTATGDITPANNTDTETTDVVRPVLPECDAETLNSPGDDNSASVEDDADFPGSGVLIVTGTSSNDTIIVETNPKDRSEVRVRRNGRTIGEFETSDFDRIVVFALEGNDKVIINAKLTHDAVLFGDDGNDQLFGARGNDSLDGGDGNDKLFGGSGNDALCGEDGNDLLYGQAGDDTLHGEEGNDKLFGEAGNDLAIGGDGNDFLFGGSGNDRVFGLEGNDSVYGDSGDDIVVGGDGNDKVYGGSGEDLMIGGDGSDSMYGDSGDDILVAGSTSHDNDEAALLAILAEWTSSRSYSDRIAKISGEEVDGENFPFFLDETSVFDDDDSDTLYGQGGQDWFIVGSGDRVKDRQRTNELETDIS